MTTSFAEYVEALRGFQESNGHTRVPAGYEYELASETDTHFVFKRVNLGYWVSYIRSRYRSGLLDSDKVKAINEAVPGFEWGPLKPGPRAGGSSNRDNEIRAYRQGGMSLQKIGERYGLTRQRVHQIVKPS